MKIVVLRLDQYSKIILTVIAIALILIALKPFLPSELEATPQVMDVNIAEVGGGYVSYGTLSVEVENSSLSVEVENPSDIGWYVDFWWSH